MCRRQHKGEGWGASRLGVCLSGLLLAVVSFSVSVNQLGPHVVLTQMERQFNAVLRGAFAKVFEEDSSITPELLKEQIYADVRRGRCLDAAADGARLHRCRT